MRILFLCQRVPWPPDRGDRISTWHFLRHLLDLGARVRVGCFTEEPRDTEAVAHIRALGAEVAAPRLDRRLRKATCLVGLLRGEALSLPFFRHRGLRATVDRWVADEPPDLIYVYSSTMAQYALPHRGPVRVMQFAELDSDKWRQFSESARGPLGRWIYRREARRLLGFETAVARAFDLSLVVSELERELFEQRIPGVRPVVLANGVDVDRFRSQGHAGRDPHAAIFTGVMDYEPNVDGVLWFASECWPGVRRQFPDARLRIVGSQPVPRVRALHGRHGVEVTGRVPETQPWFDRSAVAVAPLRLARGVQNKVLEAMSMGLPVVATRQAAQGLGAVPPDALRVADSAADTTAAVCGLFAAPAAARAMGDRAAAWVRANFRWQHMYAILDRELRRLGLPTAAPGTRLAP